MTLPLLRARHRPLFLAGMLSLAGASLWWALEVLARYAQLFVAPTPDLPPLFAHPVIADYRVVRPLSLLIGVLTLCYLRLAVGILGWLEGLLVLDAGLFLLTLLGGLRVAAVASPVPRFAWHAVRGLRLAADGDAAADGA